MGGARYGADRNAVGFHYESGLYATATGTNLDHEWIGQVTSYNLDESLNVITSRFLGHGNPDVGQFNDGPADYIVEVVYQSHSLHPPPW